MDMVSLECHDRLIRSVIAYFDSCIDSVFGVLDRDELEQRLRLHFENDMQQSSSMDKAWYALRNTVYALGCRVALSLETGPAGYAESRSQSWRYFENALAVATDLMYGRAEVTSVRALILMVLPRSSSHLDFGSVSIAHSDNSR